MHSTPQASYSVSASRIIQNAKAFYAHLCNLKLLLLPSKWEVYEEWHGSYEMYIKAGVVVIIARVRFSQLNIVHFSEYSIYDMFITGIRQVDSWGIVRPTFWKLDYQCYLCVKVNCDITVFKYVVQFGLIRIYLISSFLHSRIFKIVFVTQSRYKLFYFLHLAVSPVLDCPSIVLFWLMKYPIFIWQKKGEIRKLGEVGGSII